MYAEIQVRLNLTRRAVFLGLCGAATLCAWNSAATAQRAARRLVGILGGATDFVDGKSRLAEVQEGLRELGFVEGKDFEIAARWGEGNFDKTQAAARELVALKPDVVLTIGTAPTRAVQKLTSYIPIVFATVADPIGEGYVASLANPGGNITGFTSFESALATKWLDILKEVSPDVTRAGLLFNAQTAPGGGITFLREAEAAGARLGVQVISQPANDGDDVVRNIDALASGPKSGLFIVPSSFTQFHAEKIVAGAARHRIPAVYPFRNFVMAGGLLSYGFDLSDQVRQSVVYVARILRGESPKDLPVQAPNKFSLVINMKTARDQGFSISLPLQVSADEVIE